MGRGSPSVWRTPGGGAIVFLSAILSAGFEWVWRGSEQRTGESLWASLSKAHELSS